MAAFARVKVKGAEKTMRKLEERYGKQRMYKRASAVLFHSANRHLVPAVRAEVPTQDPAAFPSPWRRKGSTAKKPGPMRQRVYAKKLKRRVDKGPAAYVGIKTSYHKAVVRGSDPHEQPNNAKFKHHGHPGAKANDIYGRAVAKAEAAAVDEAIKQMTRRISR